ncbi:MAG: hypothetical protein IKA62_07460 [Clostridia bacterium]|nr:hypothetical protein [Clostridia bacterium]
MREGTSGFWIEQNDVSLSIGYEDYKVSEFGGANFEKTYYFNKENTKKLKDALSKKYKGTLEEMIEEAFTLNFNEPIFWDFCKEHEIEYTYSTWTSWD